MDTQMQAPAPQTTAEPPPSARRSTQPDEPLRRLRFARFGVDLTAVDGIAAQTGLVFLSEVEPDVSKFAPAAHFASWLGLGPGNRISGGRKLAAITATARKLARVLYAMVKHRQPFDPSRPGNPPLPRQRKENALRRAAAKLGYALQPLQAVAVS